VQPLKLIKYSDPKLKKPCTLVRRQSNWDEIRQLIKLMYKTMHVYRGFGLSAPQVGVSLRIIVVDDQGGNKYAMINPEIVSFDEKIDQEETCISYPGVTGYTKRYNKIVVSYLDLDAKQQKIQVKGHISALIQHEIDHLDGISYTNRMSKLHSDKINKKMKKKYGF